jgi:hypothetical protein
MSQMMAQDGMWALLQLEISSGQYLQKVPDGLSFQIFLHSDLLVCTTDHPNLLIMFAGVKESRTISHLSTTTLRMNCPYRQISAV